MTLAYLEPWYIQNSDILRTLGILRTPSIYPVKLYHIKIADPFKILVYCEPEAYSEYFASLEYSLLRTLCNPAS